MLFRSLAIWLAMCGAISAQTFVGPSTAAIGESVAVRVTGVALPTVPAEAAKAVLIGVDSPDEARPASLFGGVFWDFATGQPQLLLFFRAETRGVYVLSAVAPKDATPKIVSKRIQVGEVVPPNPNPPPPGPPNPPPTPPSPPVPIVQPFPVPGFRLLVVYESDPATSKPKLTQEQGAILTGAAVRQLLSARCVKDSKGAPEFRFLDEDADMSNAAPHWQEAMKRARRSLPWLIISDGVTGWEGPLPETVAKFTELIGTFRN
jgi:hypothetical protein